MSITDATTAIGVTRNTLSELVNEKRGLSPEIAVRFVKAFGGTEEGWQVQQAECDPAHVCRDPLKLKKLELGNVKKSFLCDSKVLQFPSAAFRAETAGS